MAKDLHELAQALEASLDPATTREAEDAILKAEAKPAFSVSLLQIVATEAYGPTARLASALYFKNYIKRNWTDEGGNYKLPLDEVTAIKQALIGLMISSPPNIQYQLGDAIGVIADSDFWERWDTLVDDLVSRLASDKPVINNGVLQVAHSIFKRWQPLYRTDELYTEINHVLSKFGAPFLSLVESTDILIDKSHSDKPLLSQLFASLNLIIKLFYDLSAQDLPPIFEDNLHAITSLLHKYLTYDNPLLHTADENEAGPLELVKSGIFEVLSLYVQKYEDAFGEHVERFVGSSWSLLTTVGAKSKYDILVSKALQFLTSVTQISKHAQSFNNEGTLGQVVELVILPNLTLRDVDVELFEDEPIEFIRRDLEGSDNDTRRRAATDFLRQLLSQFEKLVSRTVFRYINHYLSEYSQDTRANWRSKDTAVYLYSSIAAKGAVTTSHGVKTTHDFVNIIQFFQQNIARDLISDTGVEPILKVAAIKYLYTFRSQITKEQWHDAFPLLVKHLGSSDYIVYSYSAIALERAMALTNNEHQPIISPADVEGMSAQLLEHLFTLIEKNLEPAKLQENEFLMRCVMRVLIVIRNGVIPITDNVLLHLIKITEIISQNPSNPRFYYYHFEALGALIRFASPPRPDELETALYPSFAHILQNDVQEFAPYVFQLFAALLEANQRSSLTEYYRSLINPILTPELWALKGNVPALVRLLSSLISRGAADIAQQNQLERVLEVFKRLIATKTHETYGFELLECIITSFSPAALEKYWTMILEALLTRLQNSKTEIFQLRFVRLYHFISAKVDRVLGVDLFISICDKIQLDIFVPLYLTIIIPYTQKLVRPLDRKTAVISLTKTLTDSAAFAEKYKKGWALTAEALLKLLDDPPVPTSTEDLIIDQDVDDMSFGVGFTQLTTIRKPVRDPWHEITDVRLWVGQYLTDQNHRQGGKIKLFGEERLLGPEARLLFAQYLRG